MEKIAEKPMAKPTVRKAPMFKVLVHNEPVTVAVAVFVIKVLMNVFHKTEIDARKVMREAHETEVALVEARCLEQAELRLDMDHSMAKSAKYPSKFSIEPA